MVLAFHELHHGARTGSLGIVKCLAECRCVINAAGSDNKDLRTYFLSFQANALKWLINVCLAA